MCDVDDSGSLHYGVFEGESTGWRGQVEFLQLRLCSLSSFARGSTIVTLNLRSVAFAFATRPTYPVEPTRLDHVETGTTSLGSLVFKFPTWPNLGSRTDLTINPNARFRVPTSQNRGDTKRPHAGVKSVRLDIASYSGSQSVDWDGRFVRLPPAACLVSCSGGEMATVG